MHQHPLFRKTLMHQFGFLNAAEQRSGERTPMPLPWVKHPRCIVGPTAHEHESPSRRPEAYVCGFVRQSDTRAPEQGPRQAPIGLKLL